MQSIAVVPAAGQSRRMGQAKLLLPWRGKPIIQHVLETWRQSPVTHVIVVVRAEDAALLQAIESLGVEVVRADPAPEQMKDSVALGLGRARQAYAPTADDVWLLAPADMPRLSSTVIAKLLAAHNPRQPQILVPRSGEKSGHPVLFPWALADEVEPLGPDEGLNVLRERFAHRAVLIDDPSVFDDLDTPEDYRRLGK